MTASSDQSCFLWDCQDITKYYKQKYSSKDADHKQRQKHKKIIKIKIIIFKKKLKKKFPQRYVDHFQTMRRCGFNQQHPYVLVASVNLSLIQIRKCKAVTEKQVLFYRIHFVGR